MSKITNAVKRFIYKPDPKDTGAVIELTEELAPPPEAGLLHLSKSETGLARSMQLKHLS